MFDFIVIGGATKDIIFLTDQGKIVETPENLTEQRMFAFEYGAKIRSEEVFMDFGGGACNAGITFSKMGLEVAAVCRVGSDDIGKSIINNLHTKNIDTSLFQTDDNKNSAISFIVVNSMDKGKDRVIFSYRGASDCLAINPEDIKTKWIYLTALYGNWKNNLEKIGSMLDGKKIKLAWNPGTEEIKSGRKHIMEIIKKTEIFIVNKDEAIELVQKDETNSLNEDQLNNVNELIKVIIGWGGNVVVITDGENGAYVGKEDDVFYSPAMSVEKTDTVGAGDAFGSAFVSGYEITGNIEDALKFGILNSGSVVSQFGAQKGILSKDDIENDMENIKVNKK